MLTFESSNHLNLSRGLVYFQPVKTCLIALILLPILAVIARAATETPAADRPRVLVLTDISNEPDDEESLVRFLVYANEFKIEGLIATTSTWLRQGPREDLIRRHLAAYAQVRPNLLKHASDFPDADQLAAVTKTGQTTYGMAAVGPGHQTPGSQHIVDIVTRPDPQAVWITVWGGANTLAQSLLDLRASLSADKLSAVIAKLRVYAISDQDDAGAWIRREFPDLFYIVSPSRQDADEYWRATWTGISGDRFYKNGTMHCFEQVDNPWLQENIAKNHGALGALYPRFAYIMEGDTPSFLGLIQNGLGSATSPDFGGWGGRYVLYQATGETRKIWTNNARSRDTVTADNGKTETSDSATIWRWRGQFQNDFAARMNWCVSDSFAKANHNPHPVLNGDTSQQVVKLKVRAGSEIALSAAGTDDPDHDAVHVTWWIYSEAGTLQGATLSATEGLETKVKVPVGTKAGTIHVILQAEDAGTPHLFAYRRVVLDVTP